MTTCPVLSAWAIFLVLIRFVKKDIVHSLTHHLTQKKTLLHL